MKRFSGVLWTGLLIFFYCMFNTFKLYCMKIRENLTLNCAVLIACVFLMVWQTMVCNLATKDPVHGVLEPFMGSCSSTEPWTRTHALASPGSHGTSALAPTCLQSIEYSAWVPARPWSLETSAGALPRPLPWSHVPFASLKMHQFLRIPDHISFPLEAWFKWKSIGWDPRETSQIAPRSWSTRTRTLPVRTPCLQSRGSEWGAVCVLST